MSEWGGFNAPINILQVISEISVYNQSQNKILRDNTPETLPTPPPIKRKQRKTNWHDKHIESTFKNKLR